MKVAIAKYGDRIPVEMPDDIEDAGRKIDALCATHGKGGVYVNDKTVAQWEDEDAARVAAETAAAAAKITAPVGDGKEIAPPAGDKQPKAADSKAAGDKGGE